MALDQEARLKRLQNQIHDKVRGMMTGEEKKAYYEE